MTLNVRVPLISSELDYTMAFHISSYTDQSYTISLQDENGRDETPKYLISQISANEGTSEVDNVYFSDNGVNTMANAVLWERLDRNQILTTVRIPTNFDDYLTSYGRLPAGSSGWPDNAVIMVSASIVQTRVSISQFLPLRNLQLMKLRHDKIGVASSRDEIEELLPGFYADEPKLGIPIGGCGHKFITCA